MDRLRVGEIYLRANGQYAIILSINDKEGLVQFEVLSPPQPDAKGACGIISNKGNWMMPGDRRTVSRQAFVRALVEAGNQTVKRRREEKKKESP